MRITFYVAVHVIEAAEFCNASHLLKRANRILRRAFPTQPVGTKSNVQAHARMMTQVFGTNRYASLLGELDTAVCVGIFRLVEHGAGGTEQQVIQVSNIFIL